MNIMATGRKGSFFIAEFFPKCIQSKDQNYIAEKLHLGHTLIKDLNLPTVAGVVTDNASVMLKATSNLVDKYTPENMDPYQESKLLSTLGCVLHHYSLLFKDFIKIGPIAPDVANVKAFASFFIQRNKALGMLVDGQKQVGLTPTVPPLPGATRIGGVHIILTWFQKNATALKTTVVHPKWRATQWNEAADAETTHQDVEHIFGDATFWKHVETALVLTDPLWGYMKAAGTEGCGYTAYVYHDMLMYMGHVKELHQPTADHSDCLEFTNAEKKTRP